MSEQANDNDNLSFKRQPFLDFHELLFETGASAERYNLVFLYHMLSVKFSPNMIIKREIAKIFFYFSYFLALFCSIKPFFSLSSSQNQIHYHARDMSKWNQQQYRSQILTLLDWASEEELKEILASCRGIVK